jgi:hypothetical protein
MAKGKSTSPVVISLNDALAPNREFVVLKEATGEGFYIRELRGRSLLKCKERLNSMKDIDEVAKELAMFDLAVDVLFEACQNEDGTPYFSTREEAEEFGDVSLPRLRVLFEAVMQVSTGMEATDNLPNDPNSSSTDNSPKSSE